MDANILERTLHRVFARFFVSRKVTTTELESRNVGEALDDLRVSIDRLTAAMEARKPAGRGRWMRGGT
jgi:hypothetical protein